MTSPSAALGGRHTARGVPLGIAVALATGAVGALALGAATGPADETVLITCPLRALTGLPCPFCGMTHALITAGAGEVDAALALAPAVPAVAVVAVALLAAGLPRLLRRQALAWPRWLSLTLIVALLAAWIARLTGIPGGPA